MCLCALFHRNMIPSNLIEATFQQVSGQKEETHSKLSHTPLLIHILTDLCACSLVLQYRTDLVPIVQNSDSKESQANYVYVMPDYHNPRLGHPVFLEITPAPDIKYKIVPSTSKGMNVLGIVIFSATMGETITQLIVSQHNISKLYFLLCQLPIQVYKWPPVVPLTSNKALLVIITFTAHSWHNFGVARSVFLSHSNGMRLLFGSLLH